MTEKKLVLVTNDDGVQSQGIIELARAVSKTAKVAVVAPEAPQSATALSLTFHKPLRVNSAKRDGMDIFAVSGSPGDCVMIGVNSLLSRRPDLVISGINYGDNATLQDVLASGTVAAAIEGTIMGIPAIAFSMEVPEVTIFSTEQGGTDFSKAAAVASEIVREVLENGIPRGVELLNVNFPAHVGLGTPIRLTTIAKRKYIDRVLIRRDPRGRPYYWMWGEKLRSFGKSTDAHAIHTERAISITPMALALSLPPTKEMEALTERVRRRVAGVKNFKSLSHK
jgi:5'-nucleotidase